MATKTVKSDQWIPTACKMCFNACGVKAHVVNGVVVRIEGNPDCPSSPGGKICAKGNAGLQEIYSPTRVTTPLKRTNPAKGIGVDPKWVEISWQEAIDTVGQKLKKVKADDPRKIVFLSFDIDWYVLLRAPFMLAFGTPNAWTGGPRYWCGNALHPTAFLTTGTMCYAISVEHCKYLLLMGAQSGFGLDDAPSLTATELGKARVEKGLKLVCVDPVMSTAPGRADEWVPIRPGTDAAFALAVCNTLVNELGIYDAKFLKIHTNAPYLVGPDGHYVRDKTSGKALVWDTASGSAKTYDDPQVKDLALLGNYKVNGVSAEPAFQRLKEHLKKYTPEMAAEITTIPAKTIRRIAKEFGEAAEIGSTIVIDGKTLPLRPACAHWLKGPSGHKHSVLTGFAMQLMNMLVGAINVPGGHLGENPIMLPNEHFSQSWAPTEGPDGMLTPGALGPRPSGFPPRKVIPPKSLDLEELFPAAQYSEAMAHIVLSNPEKFKSLGYTPEAIVHYASNMIFSTDNPKMVEAWLKKVPFQVSFVTEINEMAEFADIILPTATYLESLSPMPNHPLEWQEMEVGYWYYELRQPVVDPPPGVRQAMAVMFEDMAEAAGVRKDLYKWLNTLLGLKEPYNLDLEKKYTWEEFCDLFLKAKFGPEHDLAWFKKHGLIKWPRKIEEIYMTPFIKARIPVYLEHYLDLGQEVKKMADSAGFTWWDVSDYQPLPDFKPCPSYENKSSDYDLYMVTYRLPYHTFTVTGYNTWLDELTEYTQGYDVRINSETAKRKGLKDGDLVWLESEHGEVTRVKGRIKITEGIHPEVVGIPGHFGHWASRLPAGKDKGVQVNYFYIPDVQHMDFVGGALDSCLKMKITKAS